MNNEILTEEEVLTGSTTIGIFMGLQMHYMPEVKKLMVNVKSDVEAYLGNWPEMAFHNDWNWIMPVARKCIDSYYDGRSDIYAGLTQVNIVKLFRACVAFIDWLEKQPPRDEVWTPKAK
jgi:hypothetical protein